MNEEEFESCRRLLRQVSRVEHRCRACGKLVAIEAEYVRRDNDEPWVDPFEEPGVARSLANHSLFCRKGRRWRRWRRFAGFEASDTFKASA